MRVLIDVPDDDLSRLDLMAEQQGCSRAALVREAIDDYLRARLDKGWIGRGCGFWRGRATGPSTDDQKLPD